MRLGRDRLARCYVGDSVKGRGDRTFAQYPQPSAGYGAPQSMLTKQSSEITLVHVCGRVTPGIRSLRSTLDVMPAIPPQSSET